MMIPGNRLGISRKIFELALGHGCKSWIQFELGTGFPIQYGSQLLSLNWDLRSSLKTGTQLFLEIRFPDQLGSTLILEG